MMDSPDPIVNSVILKFKLRSIEGMRVYKQTMAQNQKATALWVEDVQEELMDAVLYLERLKHKLRELRKKDGED